MSKTDYGVGYGVGVYEERHRILAIIAKELKELDEFQEEYDFSNLSTANIGSLKALIWLNHQIAQEGWEE